MQTLTVGVSPGTTTLLLNGLPTPGTAASCDTPAKTRWQRYLFHPPGKKQLLAPFKPSAPVAGPVAQVLVPYGSIESLRGLGYMVTPNGYVPGAPSPYQIVASNRTNQVCSEPINGLNGIVPTDLQLSKQWGFTPVTQTWIPFKEGAWDPAPWSPPSGRSVATDHGYMAPTLGRISCVGCAGPRATALGADSAAGLLPPIVTTTAASTPTDIASLALEELRQHQAKLYNLSVISVVAVASTAAVNILRHLRDIREDKRRGIKGVSGTGKRRGR